MESFLALPLLNVLDRQRWGTREKLRPAILHGSRRPITAGFDSGASAGTLRVRDNHSGRTCGLIYSTPRVNPSGAVSNEAS